MRIMKKEKSKTKTDGHRKLEDNKDEKNVCLGCGTKWRDKYPCMYTDEYCYDCYFKHT